jgi:hypothetical protein
METVDFAAWIRSPLGSEFAAIGLEPPRKIGRTEYQQEVKRITEILNEATNIL